MSHHPRFEPMPERASDVALDLALRPFVDRFIEEDKRPRARAALTPKAGRLAWQEVLGLVNTKRGSTFGEADLAPWHGVRGVFLIDKDAYTVDARTATGYYVTDPWLFASYGATFAVICDAGRHSLLFT